MLIFVLVLFQLANVAWDSMHPTVNEKEYSIDVVRQNTIILETVLKNIVSLHNPYHIHRYKGLPNIFIMFIFKREKYTMRIVDI